MHSASETGAAPHVHFRRITLDHPWRWLSAGWVDMCSVPAVSYIYGGFFTAAGFVLLFLLEQFGATYLILPMGFGFALIGPIAAVGLYEVSRRLTLGQVAGLGEAMRAAGRNGSQIALVGLFLLIAFLAWVRLAMLEFMLFFGSAPPSLDHLFNALLTSPQSMPFLIVGTITGGVLALTVFAMTAIAVPMLVAHPECDAMTAMLTSLDAVRQNFRPMMLWAFLIAFFTLFGMSLFFVGLLVCLPLVGHASWHAYRDLVE
jgi:uncharacterized membrane protein